MYSYILQAYVSKLQELRDNCYISKKKKNYGHK